MFTFFFRLFVSAAAGVRRPPSADALSREGVQCSVFLCGEVLLSFSNTSCSSVSGVPPHPSPLPHCHLLPLLALLQLHDLLGDSRCSIARFTRRTCVQWGHYSLTEAHLLTRSLHPPQDARHGYLAWLPSFHAHVLPRREGRGAPGTNRHVITQFGCRARNTGGTNIRCSLASMTARKPAAVTPCLIRVVDRDSRGQRLRKCIRGCIIFEPT